MGNHRMNARLVLASVAVGIGGFAGEATGQPDGVIGYEVSVVAPLDGHRSSNAVALDDFARLVGRSTPFSGASTPLVWVSGQTRTLPGPSGHHNPVATNISPTTGLIVGYALSDQNGIEQATAWVLGGGVYTLENLPDTLGGIAMAVDDNPWPASRIVGRGAAFGPDYAALWLNEHVIDIGGISSAATDNNKAGDIVGSWKNELGATRPVMWRDFNRIDLGGEPLNASGDAYSINNYGEVVGQLSGFGPFLWRDGQRLALPAPSPCWTIPHSINDDGLIVGEYSIDSQCRAGYEHALLWAPAGAEHTAIDLNDLNPLHPEIELTQAWDINGAGQIAAIGKLADGNRRGLLLTPYHFELSPPVPGIAGQRNTITLTGLQPDQVVALLWGMTEGARVIPPACPGASILIRDPKVIGSTRADSQGTARFSLSVPPMARGMTIRFQAVAPQQCQVSHAVTHTFE